MASVDLAMASAARVTVSGNRDTASVDPAMALAARVTVSGNRDTGSAAQVTAPVAQGKVKVAEGSVPTVWGLAKVVQVREAVRQEPAYVVRE